MLEEIVHLNRQVIRYILLSEAFSTSYRSKLLERDFACLVQDFEYNKIQRKTIGEYNIGLRLIFCLSST